MERQQVALQRCIDIAIAACSLALPGPATRSEKVMFYIGDLFQWERFITPSIIKLFYWLVVVIVILGGLSGLVTALGTLAFNPIARRSRRSRASPACWSASCSPASRPNSS